MFSKLDKQKSKVSPVKNTEAEQVNLISENTKIEGTLNTEGNIRISGYVKGDIVCTGKVMVSSTGRVEGTVNSEIIENAGKIVGTVIANNRLKVNHSGKINGDIKIQELEIEKGGVINGNIEMQQTDKRSKPSKNLNSYNTSTNTNNYNGGTEHINF